MQEMSGYLAEWWKSISISSCCSSRSKKLSNTIWAGPDAVAYPVYCGGYYGVLYLPIFVLSFDALDRL